MTFYPDCNANRIAFLDVARGIGIVFVLLGHNVWSNSQTSAVIFNFHMPLFFFLSGVLFSTPANANLKSAFRKAFRVFSPFPFFSALAGIVFLVSPEMLNVISKKMLLAFVVHGEPWFNKPLWFFVSLSFVSFVFAFFARFLTGDRVGLKRIAFLSICCLLAWLSSKTTPSFRAIWSPAMIATVPFGLFWFGLGFFVKGFLLRIARAEISPFPLLALAVLFALVLSVGVDVSAKPDIRTARMGNWRVFPLSLCGIAAVLLSALAIPSRLLRPLQFVGRNSVVYFALEFVTFPFVAKIVHYAIPNYRHFQIAEKTAAWQTLMAVTTQLAVLSALTPLVMPLLVRFRRLAENAVYGTKTSLASPSNSTSAA